MDHAQDDDAFVVSESRKPIRSTAELGIRPTISKRQLIAFELHFLRPQHIGEARFGAARAQRLLLGCMRRPADDPGGFDRRPDAAIGIAVALIIESNGAGEERSGHRPA